MSTLLIILAVLLSIAGIIGCIIPGIPGHPLNYLALWCIQWVFHPFNINTLIFFLVLTIIILLFDYLVPIWVGKKFGATKQGIIGSIVGMIVGMFLTPIGLVIGTIAGAIIGDVMAGRTSSQAAKSGMALFLGTLLSIGLKLILSGVMTAMVVFNLIKQI